jgi:hypothetical protein
MKYSMAALTWRARIAMGLPVLAVSPATTWGQLNISASVTPMGGGIFHYDYSVTNATALDMVILSIAVPADPLAIDNLVAPAGFLASFDPGVGFLDFIENTQPFAPSVEVSGFTFDSPFAADEADYFALNANGAPFEGTTLAPVPEPSTTLLIATTLAALIPRRRYGPSHAAPSGHTSSSNV